MITWLVIGAAGIVILVIGMIFCPDIPPLHYPLLDGRAADMAAWRLSGIEPSIVAAYLELIDYVFELDENIGKLRPTDSLYALYDSYYGPFPKSFWSLDSNSDVMELEDLMKYFEEFCAPQTPKFDCELPLSQLLQVIADARDNRPVSPQEQKNLGVKMTLLPKILGDAAV